MKIGSLFSGIGGLDLAVEAVTCGTTVWHAESDPFAAAVLAKHWPKAKLYEDVRDVVEPPRVDVVCGGFPCQDISTAGKGKGLEGARSGLWREFHRVVRYMGPDLVYVENVAALRGRGLDRVLGDLASCGLDAEWATLTASAVGAPHRRDRLFVLAYRNRRVLRKLAKRRQQQQAKRRHREHGNARQHLADAGHDGRKGRGEGDHVDWRDALWHDPHGRDSGLVFPPSPDDGEGWVKWSQQGRPVPGVRRDAYGSPTSLDARRRRGRLRCLGNGVVPRQAAAAFLMLEQRAIDR